MLLKQFHKNEAFGIINFKQQLNGMDKIDEISKLAQIEWNCCCICTKVAALDLRDCRTFMPHLNLYLF